MTGFIIFQRDALSHPLLQDDARFKAWFWIVAKACWKPTRFDVGGKLITLQRGQFCCSVRELASSWGWSKSAVERFLTRLRAETMIETASETGRMVITVCNYSKYQDVGRTPETPSETPSGTASRQQRDIKEQENKLTRDTEPKGSISKRAKEVEVVVPDWMPIDAWAGFLEMRRRIRKPATPRAQQLLIAKLGRMAEAGQDVEEVLNQSTVKSWQDVFEVKGTQNGGQSNRSVPKRTSILNAIAIREAQERNSW